MKTLLARLVLVVSVALAPALAFQAYTENQARQIRQHLVEDEARRLVRLVSSEVQRIIEGAAQVLDTISSVPSVQDDDPEACRRLVTSLIKQAPRYNAVAVVGLDGRLRCAPFSLDLGIDLSDRAYFRRALETGGVVVGDYAVGRTSHTPRLHVAKPFKNRDGVVAGVIEVAIDLNWLEQQLDRLSLPPGTAAMIADRNGTMLARRPDPANYVGKPILADHRFMLEGSEAGIAPVKDRSGKPVTAAFLPPGADPKGLLVKVSLNPELTFAEAAHENSTGLLLICAGIGWAALMTALLGRNLIRRPLGRLLLAADRWRTGDFTARTGLRPDRSEFGRLAAAFDRMAMAQEARESALRNALESTTDNVMVLDRSWRITYLNARAKAQIAPGRDVLGQVYWDVFPGAAASPFGRAYRTAMERGVPARVSAPSVIPPFYFTAHAYPSEEGLTVFFHDVTEERRIAAALAEREEVFRATFEQAAIGMVLVGLDETLQRVNDRLCAITGYAREELLARKFEDITHPDDFQADRADRRALLGGEINSRAMEKRYIRKDGAVIWINLTATMLRDPEGKPQRIMGIIEDITRRKHAEAALRESETRLQLAREAAGFGVWESDLLTNALIWSKECWQFFGREPQPAATDRETWLASIHPDDRQRVDDERAAAVADPTRPYDTEYRVIWPDGTLRWLLSKGKMVRAPDGKPLRMVGLVMDVTASRQTEAALRRLTTDLEARVHEEVAAREAAQARAAQAERLQALGQLAGGIAHDFNNVLQAIAGAAAMIEIHPGEQAGVLRYARRTIDAVERGASVTRRLLAFGRRGDLRAEAVDVAALLSGMNEILAHTLGAGVDVDVSIQEGLPPLRADRGQLETTLINLAINARDAMPEGGRLTLSATAENVVPDRICRKMGLAPGRYVRLAIVDTGVGMDAATLAQVCEPFFTTKGSGAGTGLGLPIASAFAEESGGALRIASAPHQGTTVTLWLPAAQAELHPEARPSAPAEFSSGDSMPARQSRLLVVDDETIVREMLAEYLEHAGYEVLVAANGAEALALLEAGEVVDALVTDLSMPGMDGTSLIRAAQQRTPGLPAVLLTGYVGDFPALTAEEAGRFLLIRKPVSGKQLVDCLCSLVKEGQGSALDPQGADRPLDPIS